MGLTQIHLMAVYSAAVVFVVAVTYVSGDDIILQRRSTRNHAFDIERFPFYELPQKRPFCNAFTGCGKKRSVESMASLVEPNSEPAVENLNRQILSEAKLWEAMQEARAEIERRRQEEHDVREKNWAPIFRSKSTLFFEEKPGKTGSDRWKRR